MGAVCSYWPGTAWDRSLPQTPSWSTLLCGRKRTRHPHHDGVTAPTALLPVPAVGFFPPSADAIGDVASGRIRELRWMNLYRPWDQVGGKIGLTREGSIERHTEQWGWKHFFAAHTNYWTDPGIVRLGKKEFEVLRTQPVKRRSKASCNTDFPLVLPRNGKESTYRRMGVSHAGSRVVPGNAYLLLDLVEHF